VSYSSLVVIGVLDEYTVEVDRTLDDFRRSSFPAWVRHIDVMTTKFDVCAITENKLLRLASTPAGMTIVGNALRDGLPTSQHFRGSGE
jgi:hypothetical protein